MDDSVSHLLIDQFSASKGSSMKEEEASDEFPVVLIVDDDAMNIEVMQTMLKVKAVKTEVAMSGPQALSLI